MNMLINDFLTTCLQIVTLVSHLQSHLQSTVSRRNCKILPQDEEWPTVAVWDTFNRSIDGHLIKTIPIGAPCHEGGEFGEFSAEKCQHVRDHWHQTGLHLESASSIMDSIFLNKSCDPFTAKEDQCIIGSYVQYTVNVSKPEHVFEAINFVKAHNIRLIVKNTGHDYMGRSTGTGAVSVWMHHLQEMVWIDDYTSSSYIGPAVKVQAGVMGYQIAEEAAKRGLVVVVGECPTVGFAGGYLQGGGHSFLSSRYGLAADQTLSFEVIISDGRLVIASPTENSDLYWALSGGGGGTYGVVWSVTVKAFVDPGATVAYLSFDSDGLTSDDWWAILSAWHRLTPNLTDVGIFATTTYNLDAFSLSPLFAPALSNHDVMKKLHPFLSLLNNEFRVSYNFSISYHQITPVSPRDSIFAIMDFQMGGRLLPRSLWRSEISFQQFMDVVKGILEDRTSFVWDVAVRPTMNVAGHPDNAVHPAWRDAERLFIPALTIDDYDPMERVYENQQRITWKFGELLRQLTVGGGAYMNEADPEEPDWKNAFYGPNYDRLLSIKDKWDPEGILYASIAVGGDRWQEMDDGRLCEMSGIDV